MNLERILDPLRRWILNHARKRHLDLSPRRWSNQELKKVAPLFTGSVVNVSGWRDEDKEDGTYRGYFKHASSYHLTNYWGSSASNDGHPDAQFMDLEADLPEPMKGAFDVVFSHTVLEHVYDVPKAVGNMAAMTRDVMITVVPFIQDEHYAGGLYGDFWRFTPLAMKRLMEANGLQLLYLSHNESPWYPVYLFAVASRHPERWRQQLPPSYDWNHRLGKNIFIYPDCVW